jgi:glycosyltransferase involved in cell wall biosynthesis
VTEVHLLLPAGYDDPSRPSGGNTYDQELHAGLVARGWTIVVQAIPESWPRAGAAAAAAVEHALATIPDGRVVVVDGLLGTAGAAALVRHSERLRLVLLVHMPGPPGGPPGVVLRAAQRVVATSEWTGRTLVEAHGLPTGNLVVAPPGAPAARLVTGTATGDSLLCVAAVTEPKGHDLLFAALADLSGAPWTCVCVGALDREPGFVRRQRRLLTDSGIGDRVQLTGALIGPALDRAYAAADVMVLPTRLESYGLVVTEALARGLPVIATDVGGVPEALGHAADGRRPGLLVPPEDPQALAAAIADWLGSAELRDALRSSAAGRRGMLCGWDQTVTTISAALQQMAPG